MNNDGSALSTLGRLGDGGILRENHGRFGMAFTTWEKEQTIRLKLMQPSLE